MPFSSRAPKSSLSSWSTKLRHIYELEPVLSLLSKSCTLEKTAGISDMHMMLYQGEGSFMSSKCQQKYLPPRINPIIGCIA